MRNLVGFVFLLVVNNVCRVYRALFGLDLVVSLPIYRVVRGSNHSSVSECGVNACDKGVSAQRRDY